jgi:(+)-trans-carveol dehydrogenase/(-)-trans-carveol dehydrogenase
MTIIGRLNGKVAFITGAARGQGRSHAVTLAREGADIIAVDLLAPIAGALYPPSTPADLEETVRLVEALDRRIVARQADVRDQASLDAAVHDGVTALGGIDIVVANAGILSEPAPAHDLSEPIWSDMIDTNLSGVWRTVKAAVPHLHDGGSVILTSSVAGLKAYGNIAHYVAAKHGVVGVMRTFALELAPRRIRVNSIHPTQVNTPMIMNEAEFHIFRPDLEHPTVDDFAEASQAVHALPEPWIEPQDVSNVVLFLASDDSRAITGVTLPIDLGCLLAP